MKQAIKKLVVTFLLFVALFMLQRAIFIISYHSLAPEEGFWQWMLAMVHGLPLDFSISGYLCIVPALLIMAALAGGGRSVVWMERIYYGIVALLLSSIFCLDTSLYSYWSQRLDYSPLFYFTTSPASAMASMEGWQMVAGVMGITAVAVGIYFLLSKTVGDIHISAERRLKSVALMLPVAACLFIPIRGSFTVAPVNISKAYFSDCQRLNHAAVNPAYSFMYSLTQQTNLDSQYNFMDPKEAEAICSRLYGRGGKASQSWLAQDRPDIYIVLLESFSKALFPTLGGEPVALGLDSIAREGLMFSNIYASGYRTDRAIPAVVSGFPAQPSISIMKYVDKAAKLPSLPKELAKIGYHSSYYYGGDADFTNMNAYLRNSGFSTIISDKDFPVKDRLSKWGVPDNLTFSRALADIAADKSADPRFMVIQTSSSHEPFDVPYANPRFKSNPKLNAFAFVDSCATAFANQLHKMGKGKNALVIFVADHYGVYPDNPEPLERFHIPLIATGGALLNRATANNNVGSQTDIAATLLAALGRDRSMFEFSKDLFDPDANHFATFAGRGLYGYVDALGCALYDCDGQRIQYASGPRQEADETIAKGFLQHLYHYISNL